MPIYEYECNACGHRMETLQRMSDEPLKECPACQALALKKLMSAAAFKLKGQGWYESDFKKPAAPKGSDAGSQAQSKGEKTGDTTGSGGGEAATGSQGKSAGKDSSGASGKDKVSTPAPAASTKD